jgi:hypothetical protein
VADSIWTKKYIEHVLTNVASSVAIVSPGNNKFSDYYKKSDIKVYSIESEGARGQSKPSSFLKIKIALSRKIKSVLPKIIKNKIGEILLIRKIRLINKELGTFDVIHFHYVYPGMERVYAPIISRHRGKMILTYWGSDLFRITHRPENLSLLDKASKITFMTMSLLDRFNSIYGRQYSGKSEIIDFGVFGYDYIDLAEKDQTGLLSYGNELGIKKNKLCIAIGYNGSSGQQHIRIINSISEMSNELKDKLHLVVHFGYNQDHEDYRREVVRNLEQSGFSWTLLDDFLDEMSVARLRCIVDVLIHAQVTDALSASMLEYIYAGATVINGDWLSYRELEKSGVHYISFHDFDELATIVHQIVLGHDDHSEELSSNRDILYRLNSWDAVKPAWVRIYET